MNPNVNGPISSIAFSLKRENVEKALSTENMPKRVMILRGER